MEMVNLTDICRPKQWKTLSMKELKDDGKYLVYGANGVIGNYNSYNHEKETVLITCRGATCGNIHISKEKSYINGNAMALDELDEEKCLKRYLYYYLKQYDMKKIISGSAQPQITVQSLKKVTVKLPDIREQQGIIKKLDNLEKIIDIRQKQIKKLNELIKSVFTNIFGNPVLNEKNWKKKELQEITTDYCTISYGIIQSGDNVENGIPIFRPIDIVNHNPKIEELKRTSKEISNKHKKTILRGNELLVTVRANIGDTYIVDSQFKGCNVGRGIVPLSFKNYINIKFMKEQFDNDEIKKEIKSKSKGITLIQLNMEDLRKQMVIIPPIILQNQFSEIIEKIEKQKSKLQKSLIEMQNLQASLMNKYFEEN